MGKKTIHIVGGPTAGGKSALALRMAKELDGEIINVDSRQIYTELPILSAQPSQEDFQEAVHHLYGTLEPNEACSAGLWREMAVPIITDLLAAGKTPIITGGNGLYIKTLIEGLSPIPDVPAEIRQAAIEKQAELGNPGFHAALAERDPETAALYHPMHTARLIHAWEILEATGKPLAQWQAIPKTPPPADWMFNITIVQPEREKLYAQIDRRFHHMLEQGAAEELEAFDKKVADDIIRPDALIVKTLGAEPLRAWRESRITKENAITLAQTETRQYAKRQTTWFKNQTKAAANIQAISYIS